jgi:hypothetical protein
MALEYYLAFFRQRGIEDLSVTVRIEQRPPCPAVDAEQEARRMQLLQYFGKLCRTSKRAKARNDAAEQIKSLLGQMPLSPRGH